MFKEILDKIKPSENEEKELLSKADYIIKRINSKVINAEAVLGGSLAKGTLVSASVAIMMANQVTYSGCPVNLMLSEIEVENTVAKTMNNTLVLKTEINAVVYTFCLSVSDWENLNSAVSIP